MTRGQKIFEKILNASAVIVDDNAVIYPSTCVPDGTGEWEGNEENQVLYLSWEESGQEFSAKFTEQNLEDAIVDPNGVILLQDNDSDETTAIRLLTKMEINPAEFS